MFRPLVIILALFAVSLALAQTAPVFTLNFEQGFDGTSAAGPVKATLDGKPELVPGKFGQALKSGPSTGYLNFPTNMLKATSGTVEMWVSPLDWSPGDTEFHAFFDTRGEDGCLYLYKYVDGNRLLMLGCPKMAGPYFSSALGLDWKPGEWHHIAGTWSANGVLVFVDGKPAGPMPVAAELPSKLAPTFQIGDHPWHLPRTSSSLVDEVRIYDRALSPTHIAAHAAGNMDFVAPLEAKFSYLKYELDPPKHEVQAMVSTGGADVPDADLAARVGIVKRGAALTAGTEKRFEGGQMVATLAAPQEIGEYQVVAQVVLKGTQAFELRRDLVIPDTTSWVGSKLGTEDKVLPPWTAVKVAGSKVSVWDREYDFAPGMGLVQQITSGKQSLLAGPIELMANLGDDPAIFTAPGKAQVSGSPTRAIVTKQLLSDGLGPATLTAKATAEYDGLVVIELSGKAPANVSRMLLNIPIRPEIALYRHRWAASWDSGKVTGKLPEGDGVIDSDKFIPYYWLGNNDRGLFWMCESDEMWPNGQAADALQIVREKDRVVLRLNLLAKGQKLPENWKFVFALQATPVKPMAKDWRKWRLKPGVNGNVDIMWPTVQPNSVRYFGYPEARDPALMTERIKALHESGGSAVPYLCLSFISAACPEWPIFRKQWAMGPVDASSSDVAAYGAGFAMASPVGKDYADFIVWKTAQFIKQYGIDGLYHDNTHPYSSTALDAGCGYKRDGKVHPTFPILGYRDLYRRMYAVMKDARPDGFTMAHMSGKVTIPILAYEDSYLDGEHFRGVVKDSYMDLMSLETFRTEYMGRQWGIMPYFLPEFSGDYAKAVEPTRGLMALLMIHDVAPWPIWCNTEVMNEALSALDAFGYVDSEFIGYFEATPPATTDMKDCYVSAYKRADGKCLLVVANLAKEDRQGTVTINGARLGLAAAKQVQSWPEKTPVEATGGKVALSVPRLGYRMLVVE
ncbi:MAG: glycoside hydrolase domain-containing protein [Armatimonadia bacterium]